MRKTIVGAFGIELEIRMLDPIEIFASKINALMSRAAARDLYDVNNMIFNNLFNETQFELLRKCIVFYASISSEVINKHFDMGALDQLDYLKIKRDLFPVLRKKDNFDLKGRKESAKNFIKELMILTPQEKVYVMEFERGEYRPELLFSERSIVANIKEHPMALWKMKQKRNEYNA